MQLRQQKNVSHAKKQSVGKYLRESGSARLPVLARSGIPIAARKMSSLSAIRSIVLASIE